MELAVTVCMKNHVYQHGGFFYKQEKGMPIGLRLSGVVAELRMCDWVVTADKMLEENEVEVWKIEDDQDLDIRMM